MLLHVSNSESNQLLQLRLDNVENALTDFRELGAHLRQFGIKLTERSDMSRTRTEFTFRIGRTLSVIEFLRRDAADDDEAYYPKVSNNSRSGRRSVLTPAEVLEVEEILGKRQETLKEIAYKMKCSVRTIRRIHDGCHVYSSRRPK